VIRPALVVMFFCLVAAAGSAQRAHEGETLTASQILAVILAVEDEIYDFGFQKQFYEVGPEPARGVTRVPLYIQPRLKDGEGTVIYKLMPYGEVIRSYHFNKDGLAVLEGEADGGFPPTQPNTLTLYMDDDDVCRWKQRWVRQHFDILDTPPPERIGEAGERQKRRVGYSAREAPPKAGRKFPPHN